VSKVLVVGAGPTGLVLANELARRDVPLRLIDQAPAPSPHSRAFGIQPGSLLALGDAFGDALADELIAAGHQVRAIVAHLDDRPALEIPFEVEGRYPFLLLLPQADTERILRDRLTQAGVAVEWGCALERLAQDGDEVRCTAGGVESLHAWVAGCDGAHSTVRHQLQVAFDGHPYVGDFMLADVEVEWPFSPDAVHVFSNERGTVAAFPFRDRRCRFFVVKREPVAEDAPLDEAGFAADARSSAARPRSAAGAGSRASASTTASPRPGSGAACSCSATPRTSTAPSVARA